ncbi:tyrosine-type recombinase/integrase [Streptosporangium sp. G11]|uniref:tyrosine-type recombinase/integrase n=1 Tax=Streptosporangium sp. G11 TaxID=3436926 RepID=UPI003EBEF059
MNIPGRHIGVAAQRSTLEQSYPTETARRGTHRRRSRPRRRAIPDLRHTCVTLLLNLGAPPRVVGGIAGHSDIEVTMTVYAHISPDDKRNTLGKLGDALGRSISMHIQAPA